MNEEWLSDLGIIAKHYSEKMFIDMFVVHLYPSKPSNYNSFNLEWGVLESLPPPPLAIKTSFSRWKNTMLKNNTKSQK